MAFLRRVSSTRALIGLSVLVLVLGLYFVGMVRSVPVRVEMRGGVAVVVITPIEAGPLAAVRTKIPLKVPVVTARSNGSVVDGVTLRREGLRMVGAVPYEVRRGWLGWKVKMGQLAFSGDWPSGVEPSVAAEGQSGAVEVNVVTGLEPRALGAVRGFFKGWFGV
jgi:hypothetical protein